MRTLRILLLAFLTTTRAQAELTEIPWSASGGGVFPTAVSADGRVVFGHRGGSYAGGTPFRWTRADGVHVPFEAHRSIGFRATSPDGSIAHGVDFDGNTPVSWTEGTGFVHLLDPEFLYYLSAGPITGASADGSVLTGTGWWWTVGDEFSWLLLGGSITSEVFVSADGRTLAGAGKRAGSSTEETWIWSPPDPPEWLGSLPGTSAAVRGLSADGRVVVGHGYVSSVTWGRPFYWTRESGFVELHDPSDSFVEATPTGIAADGSLIVGVGRASMANQEGFVWTPEHGMQRLRDVIPGFGRLVQFPPEHTWWLVMPTAVSADGSTIVGHGEIDAGHRAGFVARFPECTNGKDDDGDGTVDGADAGCNLVQLERENPQCENGLDDDGDAGIDFPADAGCQGIWDDDESGNPPEVVCGLVGLELLLPIAILRRRRAKRVACTWNGASAGGPVSAPRRGRASATGSRPRVSPTPPARG